MALTTAGETRADVLRKVRSTSVLELARTLMADAQTEMMRDDRTAQTEREALANLQVASSLLDAVVRVGSQD